jgi:hypothetical protein
MHVITGQSRLDEEYFEALKSLREHIIMLRAEKALLLSKLDDLEADAETEVESLEKELAVLHSRLDGKKNVQKQEIIFSF